MRQRRRVDKRLRGHVPTALAIGDHTSNAAIMRYDVDEHHAVIDGDVQVGDAVMLDGVFEVSDGDR